MDNDQASRLEALLLQGSALHAQHRLDDAQIAYARAAQLQPTDFRAWYLLGVIALQKQRPHDALEYLTKAIRSAPRSAEAHTEHGNALVRLDRYEAAIKSFDKAIDIAPNQAIAHHNRAQALRLLKRYESAIDGYHRAILCNPKHAAAFHGRGEALYELQRYTEALASYDRAIAIRADYLEAYHGRGNTQFKLARYEAAAASYGKVIELKPDHADAHNNRGNALSRLNQIGTAKASYDAAIALDPSCAGAFYNRGKLLNACREYEAAIEDYDAALALGFESKSLRGMRLQAKLQVCDWRAVDSDIARLVADIETHRAAPSPFTVLAISGSAALQKTAAQTWVQEEFPPDASAPAFSARGDGERIRIGYFSADLHNHATSHLMAGLLEMHDRSKFEITAFSFGPNSQDDIAKRIRSACETFLEVQDKSDAEISQMARAMQIDIAVDLKGFTRDGRPGLFAARSAPLQISFLGYPGTLGAPYMDYLVADLTVVPTDSRRHYTEKIIYLPNSYQVNDSKRRIAEAVPGRPELGLPRVGIVFCCFNNNYKITPTAFDSWMRVLRRIDGSVLWLLEDNQAAPRNLQREAARRGVDPQRLIFAKRVAPAEHLARHAAADLFIDTFPCNAHTTASDSLWAGLPVLTCVSEAFAGRVAASLLKAVGLPELITSNRTEYEELAVRLAMQPETLAEISRRLKRNAAGSTLFDTRLYTGQLEAAYAKIYDRHQGGLPPDDLIIE